MSLYNWEDLCRAILHTSGILCSCSELRHFVYSALFLQLEGVRRGVSSLRLPKRVVLFYRTRTAALSLADTASTAWHPTVMVRSFGTGSDCGQSLITSKCAYYTNIFRLTWLPHVSAIRRLQGAHRQIAKKLTVIT